jgi:hypothetical protein
MAVADRVDAILAEAARHRSRFIVVGTGSEDRTRARQASR